VIVNLADVIHRVRHQRIDADRFLDCASCGGQCRFLALNLRVHALPGAAERAMRFALQQQELHPLTGAAEDVRIDAVANDFRHAR